MPIDYLKGNIFNSKCQTIVNTVNCEGVMGKGIALEFRYRYPDMFRKYIKLCKQGKIEVGGLWIYKNEEHWILNFPTKKSWKYPSKMEYIEKGLKKFIDTYKEKGITSIAFPQLGSLNGKLNWNDVRKLMEKYLKDLDINIEIYSFDPSDKDKLFENLLINLKNLSNDDIKKEMGLDRNLSQILIRKLERNEISSFQDIRKIKGVGEKALEKISSFRNGKNEQHNKGEEKAEPELFCSEPVCSEAIIMKIGKEVPERHNSITEAESLKIFREYCITQQSLDIKKQVGINLRQANILKGFFINHEITKFDELESNDFKGIGKKTTEKIKSFICYSLNDSTKEVPIQISLIA